MNATMPEDLHRLWIERLNAGDLDGLVALYEPAAAFVAQPGQIVTGHAAIRAACAGLLALNPTATLDVRSVVLAGDVALLISTWNLAGTDAEGTPVTIAGQTSDVARRQPDGTWLCAIDNPWGDAAVGVP
jgi:uncharacterized protein (TIGR02246 family)